MTQFKSSRLYIDENAIRFIAFQVAVTCVFILTTQSPFPALALCGDFALRAFTTVPSPSALIAKGVIWFYKWKPVPQFAPPKKFAAGIGFFCSLLILLLISCHMYIASSAVAGIVILFASLEALFNICIGCYIHNWIITRTRKS